MPDDPSELLAWCEKAREILGTVRGSGPVSAVSRKDLRGVRQEFNDAPERILELRKLPGGTGDASKYQARYGALVDALGRSDGGDTTQDLASQMRKLKEEVTAAIEARKTRAGERWPQELKAVAAMEPRDAVIALARIEREVKGFRDGASGDFATQLDKAQSDVDAARSGLGRRLGDEKKARILEWADRCADAKAKKLAGGALLEVIDGLHREMAVLNAHFDACKLPRPDLSQINVKELEGLYERGYPQRTAGADVVELKITEGKGWVLEPGTDLKVLDFMQSKEIGKNWFTLKKLFKAGQVSQKQMEQVWAYRQKIVDDYLADPIGAKYKLKKVTGWLAAGSVTLESDIDVSILDHHWSGAKSGEGEILKTDDAIVKEFNDWFVAKFNAQPGIMFDVNLYASAKPRKPLENIANQTPVKQAMTSMTNAGQDVGALMKMRRFMSWEDFQAYQDTVVAEMRKAGAGKEDIDTTLKQFETADDLYQMAQSASLEKVTALIKRLKHKDRTPEQKHALEMIEQAQEEAKSLPGAEGQKRLLEAAKELEHMQDVNMWVNNELYVEGVKEVRALEAQVDVLQKKIDDGKLGPMSAEAREMAGKMARLKELATESVFYANEAYHSDGPLVHIVHAGQGVKQSLGATLKRDPTDEEVAAEKTRLRDQLSVHLCLQSFNEQTGDLLKDLAHYASEPNPGIGFYRSSKYLARLLDALALLQAKVGDLELGFDPAALSKQVEKELVSARKGAISFTGIEKAKKGSPDYEEQARKDREALENEVQAYAIGCMQKMFGVRTLAAMGDKFKGINARVNAKARKAVANEMRAAKEHEKAYFGG